MDTCGVSDCDREVRRNGWCNTHSARVRKHGDPQAHIPIRTEKAANRPRSGDGLCDICGGTEKHADGSCAVCKRRRNKKWRERNPEKAKELSRKTQVRQYGLSLEEYGLIAEKQDGVCEICGQDNGDRALVVDHCHENEHVRGLLCTKCNAAMGMFDDSIAVLRNVISYLENDGQDIEEVLDG